MNYQSQPVTERSERVLVLGADAEELDGLKTALSRSGFIVQSCEDLDTLCAQAAREGEAVIVFTKSLGADGKTRLASALERCERDVMSSLIIVEPPRDSADAQDGESSDADLFTDAVVIDQPCTVSSLVSIAKLATRAGQDRHKHQSDQARHTQSQTRVRIRAFELNERVREQAETLRLLRDVATASNSAQTVDEAISFALTRICRHTGWVVGHAFLPSVEDESALVPTVASYEYAPERFQPLLDATLGVRVADEGGLVGRVYASGHPEWTRGIDRGLDAERAALAESLEVATVAAFPIMAGPKSVGVLEFFTDDVANPSTELLDAMASIGTQLGRVIERDQAERTLRDSHRLIEKISDTAPTMIRVYDVDQQRYVFMNRRMAEFLGTSAAEFVGSPIAHFLDAVNPEDADRVHEVVQEVLDSGHDTTVAWQVRLRNAAGEWRWVRTWSVLFAPHDYSTSKQILSVSIDVTDELLNEERLRQTERLTSLGTLAAGIAHEINNPLASVVMTAQLLRRRRLGTKADEMLDNLIEDARRCGRIVRNVQRFARQEPSDRRPVDLNSVVRAAEELSRTELRRSQIRVQMSLEEGLPTISGDATELEQVVVNLLTNGAHASEAGHEVLVSTQSGDGVVRLTVRDEGCGMPPEVKRHVFDPFYTTRVREGGTGLGLSIAHGIIEDHGGTIDIDSKLGKGTRVVITLPAGRAGGVR